MMALLLCEIADFIHRGERLPEIGKREYVRKMMPVPDAPSADSLLSRMPSGLLLLRHPFAS
jgi:hypothetical protein